MQIVYRLTIFDDDNQPLVPVSGSGTAPPHNDPFVIASAPISGSQPYIINVSPNPGSAVIPDVKWQVGKYYVDVADIRTGTDNLTRWITAFLGDATGRAGLIAKKALVEESLDGGANWTPQFVGRVSELNNDSPLKYSIRLADDSERLKRTIFRGYPKPESSRTGTRKVSLLPIGILPKPGQSLSSTLIHGVRTDQVEIDEFGDPIDRPNNAEITINKDAPLGFRIDKLNSARGFIWTAKVTEKLNNLLKVEEGIGFRLETRPRLEAFNGGQIIGNYALVGLETITKNTPYGDIDFPAKAFIARDREDSLPFEDWEDFAVQFRVFAPDNENSLKDAPFFITTDGSSLDNSPIGILKDIFEGTYDELFNTGSYIPIVYDNNNLTDIFTNLDNIGFNSTVVPITEAKKINEFIENDILKPYGLGYYLEPAIVSGEPASIFKVFSLSRPTVAPTVEIKFEDLLGNEYIDWEMVKPYRVNAKSVILNELQVNVFDDTAYFIQEDTTTFVDRNALVADIFNDVSFNSYQILPSLFIRGDFLNRFTRASSIVKITVRRGVYENVNIGDYVKTTIDWQPNTSTFRRGGTRIMQVISKTSYGPRLEFELLDSGIDETLLAPTLGTPSGSGDYEASISVTGTELLGVVKLEYALVDTNTEPSANAEWLSVERFDIDLAEIKTFSVGNLPRNKFIFFRARTETTTRKDGLLLPSSYVVSSGLQLSQLAAPTGLTISDENFYTATISWNPSKIFNTEVWHTGNEAGTLQLYNVYPPSTSFIIATGFDEAPTSNQVAAVRFSDGINNISAFTTASFTRGTGGEQAPKMGGIFIFNDLFL